MIAGRSPADSHCPYTTLFRSHLVGGGANIAYAQLLLGHRSLRTTQVYTRVSVPEIKVTHAQTHPRKTEPSPREIETAHAPLKSLDRKSTRLNSSHDQTSYAVF